MEVEEETIFLPLRRSTQPTVFDSDCLQVEGDGIVRSGSVYGAESGRKSGKREMGGRKSSLPDIAAAEGAAMSREAVAVLSAQRREAIRRQEEEEERLRINPLLHLVSPEFRNWLKTHQLVILIVVLNAVLGYIFFCVIL